MANVQPAPSPSIAAKSNMAISGDLRKKADKYNLPELEVQAGALEADIVDGKQESWKVQRKKLKARGYQYRKNQSVVGDASSAPKKKLSDYFMPRK